jgi:DNA-binding SARP family transcriptional activator/tetratricopeptide (TPR) repeat protein
MRIGGAKERLVLALLVLRAGEVVSRDALIDALWNDDPPTSAVKTLQGYVARARRGLEAAGLAGVLATREPGYVLTIPADAIDVTSFERLAASGRGALVAGDAVRATAELGEALELWRGDALADCRGGGWAAAEAVRLDELRWSTVEDRIDADLKLGRHGVLVGELESLVARQPFRERFWSVLMLALYRSGRQADALRAYRRARAVLVAELGLEPGAELRQLEAAVLAGDPSLDLSLDHRMPPADGELAISLPRRIAASSLTVFVGRAQERDGLNTTFKSVAAGERHVMFISGEPGVGKTSLSAAFAQDAFEDGAVVLYGRCDEDLRNPYQPWVEVLTHLVAQAPVDLLAAHIDARGTTLARLAPDLAHIGRTEPRSSSDAESERSLLFGGVVDLLARVSTLAPVVLVLDDLHWADRPTLQLVRHVVAAEAPLRLFLIGTFRDSDVRQDHPLPEALAALHREPAVERLALRGLDDDELLTLLDMSARDTGIDDESLALRDALLAETDGNPFFVGEMLRHLLETRVISQDEHGRWTARADLRTSGLPVSLREVIGRRIARLGAPTQGALSRAAVIGRGFDVDVLARVTGLDDDTLVDLCDRAVTAMVLTEAEVPGRYTFAHALIEHALYDELSASRRGRIHRAIAEALEELSGDDPERAGAIAYHWRYADPPEASKAIAYAQLAGDRALAQLAPEAALLWYEDALNLLDQASVDNPRSRAALLVGLGEAQRQMGDPAHRETLIAAARLADSLGAVDLLVRAALRNNRGFNSIAGAVDRDRVEILNRALTRVGATDSSDRARLLAILCVERLFDADFDERLSMATEAVAIARRIGDATALVDAIRLCQEAITGPQTLELRIRWNAEACELADGLGDPTARLFANDYRALAALEAGDLATMRTALGIFEFESERIGQPFNRWQLAYHRAWTSMLEGDLDRAEHAMTEALALGDTAGFPHDAVQFYVGQLLTLRRMQGRIHETVPDLEQVAHDNAILRIFTATLAFAKSSDDVHPEVRELLDTELAHDFPLHADSTWLAASVIWAGAAAQTRHQPASMVLYERLLPWHDQFANTYITPIGAVAHTLGALAHVLGRHDDAEQWFSEALALHEALHAPFFIALTQAAWAALLVDRNKAGDSERARALAETAFAVASERGYGYVARDAQSVLNRSA